MPAKEHGLIFSSVRSLKKTLVRLGRLVESLGNGVLYLNGTEAAGKGSKHLHVPYRASVGVVMSARWLDI